MSDIDTIETQEWREAFADVIRFSGLERAQFLLHSLIRQYAAEGTPYAEGLVTDYINTITLDQQPDFPGDIDKEKRLLALLRWNAIAMVLHAGRYAPELGGHIATYASIATIYEIGFHHFFRARNANSDFLGDLLYIQGHSSPGIYARAFLEGRLTEQHLLAFRQEVDGGGLSSYPHPWLMPDFWQFPTVSMGLGLLQAIYQARFLRYLEHRKLRPASDRKVWVFCGDGEMDEPESVGALTLPVREHLNNLILVVNCNLQRLDGPVRGNGKIIEELAALFRGAGWHVIKVIWGSLWDDLLDKDESGLLRKRMSEVLDGEYQNYITRDAAYFRKHFFGAYPELSELVAGYSDTELDRLRFDRGGHDPKKVYAAYAAAVAHKEQPVVILIKTIKGFGMGDAGEGLNTTHQQKKMSSEDLAVFCERFELPIPKEQLSEVPFYKPREDSPELCYLQERRSALGGYLPARHSQSDPLLVASATDLFGTHFAGSGDRSISTTMAFVRMLGSMLKDKQLGARVVPIVPDESRTFGMEGLFRQIGIYSPHGQRYEPVDRHQVMYYKESQTGQLLEEGINEAGAFASWMAAATSYSTNALTMIPFYIYYSMFGFQRIGDLAWAAGDMRARGFLLGATAGRTTLAGEGLQHQDGHSHIMSALIPNCVSYDPTYSYELAVIIRDGLYRMCEKQEDIYYYLTLMNENYLHPPMPEREGIADDIVKGMYLLEKVGEPATEIQIQLLGCGAILNEIRAAARLLAEDYGVASTIWSVTSFTELRRDGLEVERQHNLAFKKKTKKLSHVARCLQGRPGPVLAATDYVRLFADQIRGFVPQSYTVLGTDGFGRSDTRGQLRRFFEVNAAFIAFTAVRVLIEEGLLSEDLWEDAVARYDIDTEKINPVEV